MHLEHGLWRRSSHFPDQVVCLGTSTGFLATDASFLASVCPARSDLLFDHTETLFTMPLEEGRQAICRCVVGTLDPSSGDRDLFLKALTVTREQLGGYGNNVIRLIDLLLVNGWLNVDFDLPVLDSSIEVSNSCFIPGDTDDGSDGRHGLDFVHETERLVRAMDIHGEIVLVGLEDSLSYLQRVFALIPMERRSKLSFSVNLKIRESRPFSIRVFSTDDGVLMKEIARRQLRTINFSSRSSSLSSNH